MDCVPVKLQGPVYGLKSEPPDLAYSSTEGNRPRAPGNVVPSCCVDGASRSPIGRHDWPTRPIIAFVQGVVDEVLQQHLVHMRSVRGAGDGKYIIDQDTHCPMSGLHQCYHRRPKAELALTRLRAGRCGQNKGWSRPIDELAGTCRRQEERRVHISNSNLATRGLRRIRLPHKWLDHASDQHDLIAEFHRDHRLDIEDIPRPVVRTDAKIAVVLQWYADQAGHRVLRRLG